MFKCQHFVFNLFIYKLFVVINERCSVCIFSFIWASVFVRARVCHFPIFLNEHVLFSFCVCVFLLKLPISISTATAKIRSKATDASPAATHRTFLVTKIRRISSNRTIIVQIIVWIVIAIVHLWRI